MQDSPPYTRLAAPADGKETAYSYPPHSDGHPPQGYPQSAGYYPPNTAKPVPTQQTSTPVRENQYNCILYMHAMLLRQKLWGKSRTVSESERFC